MNLNDLIPSVTTTLESWRNQGEPLELTVDRHVTDEELRAFVSKHSSNYITPAFLERSRTVPINKFDLNGVMIGIEWEPQFTMLEAQHVTVQFGEIPTSKPESLVSTYSIINGITAHLVLSSTELHNRYGGIVAVDAGIENLEVKTNPVFFSDLDSELKRVNTVFDQFVKDLRVYTMSGIASFLPVPCRIKNILIHNPDNDTSAWLPASPGPADTSHSHYGYSIPSKHVNLSYPFFLKRVAPIDYHQVVKVIHEVVNVKKKQYPAFSSLILSKDSDALGLVSSRVHVTVPYNFTDYAELAKVVAESNLVYGTNKIKFDDIVNGYDRVLEYICKWADSHPMDDPLLVNFIRNERVANRNKLF